MTLQFLLQVQIEGDALRNEAAWADKVRLAAQLFATSNSTGTVPTVKLDSLPPAEMFDVAAYALAAVQFKEQLKAAGR